ncbi:MAG: DinB family protein [Phycisphaerae bacterium]|nr:DinB family protein [Phycisphaerae bacterium]
MSARLPWIERKWRFDFPVELFPDILERLRGTPARLEEMLRGVSPDTLARREREGTLSIQENAGHLLDVEQLWTDRLDDFLSGADALRAADMTNRRTHAADHHATPVAALLSSFRAARGHLVSRLDGLEDSDFARAAHHGRLGGPMRLVDMCLFAADHDDYHLARIRELMA